MSVGGTHESALKKKIPSVGLTCSINLQKLCLGKSRLAKPKETTGEGSAAQPSSLFPRLLSLISFQETSFHITLELKSMY